MINQDSQMLGYWNIQYDSLQLIILFEMRLWNLVDKGRKVVQWIYKAIPIYHRKHALISVFYYDR